MADISKTISIIFQGQDQTGPALAGVEKSLAGLGTEATTANTQLGATNDQIDELGKKGDAIGFVSDAMKALAASLVVKAFIDANVAAETFERTMTLLKGSSEAAAQEFEYVSDFAQKLGLDLFSTADAYAQLAAATRGTNLEGQGTRDIFEAVATAMASLGKSSADTEGALLAVSQMISKGTVSAEELKQQLGERLPGAFQAAANATGVTTAELGKLLEGGKIVAEDFLPKFAAELNKTFGGATFDGYAASMNRLRTEISMSFIEIGDAGAFDLLIAGVNAATATLTGAIAVIKLLGETWGNFAFTIQTGDWSGFADRFRESLDKAAGNTKSLVDALTGVKDEAQKVGTTGAEAGTKVAEGFEQGALSAKQLEAAAKDVDKFLKALGIDPKTFADPIADINKAFGSLATNAAASGEQIVVGLTGALKNLPPGAGVAEIVDQIDAAFKAGKLTADEYAQAMALIKVRMDDASPSFAPVTEAAKTQADELKKTAEAAKKAEESARDYALEMEKIASNERIKFIEANVSLNIADLEAQTARVEAAFESINNTISASSENIVSLFGLLKDASFNEQFDIRDQLEIENRIREEAFKLQKDLTEEQIKYLRNMNAQAARGDALIKVDGAGLQPHLEAFMWEILKTIQVRVNAQGMSMLLGV